MSAATTGTLQVLLLLLLPSNQTALISVAGGCYGVWDGNATERGGRLTALALRPLRAE